MEGNTIDQLQMKSQLYWLDEHQSKGLTVTVLFTTGGQLQRITETHPSYMALQYPLLFPYGEDGWRINIPHNMESSSARSKQTYVSIREYYCFRLQ